jgi:hypothetical protein
MIKINTFLGILVVGLVLLTPLSSNASSTTFRFFGNDGIDLSNYYIYFQGSSPGSGPDDVEVGYTKSLGMI